MRTIHPDSDPPTFLFAQPKPQLIEQRFNNQPYLGWQGRMEIKQLRGWVSNPRLEAEVERFQEEHVREPNDDELLELLITHGEPSSSDDEVDDGDGKVSAGRQNPLVVLARDIRVNAVREPLVISAGRKLLDGNRRYFACLYLLRMSPPGDEARDNYTKVPVWVMPSEANDEDEDQAVTELNFADLKVEWPYAVKARHIYQDRYVRGMSDETLRDKYRTFSKGRLNQILRAAKLAYEFVEFHDDMPAAKEVAQHLIWFDELQRSNRLALETDQFRIDVFKLLLEDQTGPNPRFRRARDFVRLASIHADSEAWTELLNNQGRNAVQKAEFVLDRKTFEDRIDAAARMKRVNQLLLGLVDGDALAKVGSVALDEFGQLAANVPGAIPSPAPPTASMMIAWLAALTSAEVAALTEDQLAQLEEGLTRVIAQRRAYAQSA